MKLLLKVSIECEIFLNDVRVQLVDSAGLRVTDDPVEKIGVQRTLGRISETDLILYVRDATVLPTEEDETFLAGLPVAIVPDSSMRWVLRRWEIMRVGPSRS